MERLDFSPAMTWIIIMHLKDYRDEILRGEDTFRVIGDKATPEEHLAFIEKLLPQLNENEPCIIELQDRKERCMFASINQNPKS